jgi:hypothetical protein
MSKRNTKKSLKRNNILLSFEDFLLEGDNYERSIKGLDRFGMNDRTKYPKPLMDHIKKHGFEKISAEYAGFDNVIFDQIYHRKKGEYELSIFIQEEHPHEITVSLWHNDTSTGFYAHFEWDKYQEVMKLISNYNFDDYKFLIKDKKDHKSVDDSIKNSLKDYDTKWIETESNY